MIGMLGSKLPVEPEHTGVDVNVGDLKDETLKCHIERWHIERWHIERHHKESIYVVVELE